MATMMNKAEYPSIGETIWTGVLSNGLSVFVVPKKGFRSCYALFGTHYGGAMRNFELEGKVHETPEGIAHYLEHKMFDMPEGENALSILSENGADPNAFTSTDMTCYYFSCTSRFEENLRMLLKFVSSPYFTEESVEKERDIITQEILMGADSPSRKIYQNLLSLLYNRDVITGHVAGTVESIQKITADLLYDCHRVFYAASNMALCVEGDVDPEAVYRIAEEILPVEKQSIPCAIFGEHEGMLPLKTSVEQEMPIAMPEFLIGAKDFDAPLSETGDAHDRIFRRLVSSLSLRLLCGTSSPFYMKLYSEGLITHSFDYDTDFAANTVTVIIGGESNDPNAILKALNKEVAAISEKGFDRNRFEIAKKSLIGSRLRSLEDFESVCTNLFGDWVDGFFCPDISAILQEISCEDCEAWVREILAPERLAISVLRPSASNV
jgi:predicted Zn-dependent peptidase